MYVVLTGAKRNLGDFLITERTCALLRELRPEHDLTVLPSWEPLVEGDVLREAAAIIIAGGPGYQQQMYPGVYPLMDLARLPAPLVVLGGGWKGPSGDEASLASYRFSEPSLSLLRKLAAQGHSLGCRDWLTVDVLARHGIHGADMTGCPVWYHLPSLGTDMHLPRAVERLVVTPAQRPELAEQSVQLLHALQRLLPHAERICSFHRGLGQSDEWISSAEVDNNQRIAAEAERAGFRVEDVTADTAKLAFYDECDLHVGYRVHAHIYFASKRRPSLLLHEDGRGAGVSHALDLRGVEAKARTPLGLLVAAARSPRARYLGLRVGPEFRPDPAAVTHVVQQVQRDMEDGFARYAGVGRTIDAYYARMERFVRALP